MHILKNGRFLIPLSLVVFLFTALCAGYSFFTSPKPMSKESLKNIGVGKYNKPTKISEDKTIAFPDFSLRYVDKALTSGPVHRFEVFTMLDPATDMQMVEVIPWGMPHWEIGSSFAVNGKKFTIFSTQDPKSFLIQSKNTDPQETPTDGVNFYDVSTPFPPEGKPLTFPDFIIWTHGPEIDGVDLYRGWNFIIEGKKGTRTVVTTQHDNEHDSNYGYFNPPDMLNPGTGFYIEVHQSEGTGEYIIRVGRIVI